MKISKPLFLVGSVIVFFGFLAPYISGGRLIPIWFFWAGFLLILFGSFQSVDKLLHLQYVRLALTIHVIGSLLVFQFYRLIINTLLARNFGANISFNWIANLFTPISKLVNSLFPYTRTELGDGTIQFQISYIRAATTSFLDIVFYMLCGFVVGNIILSYRRKSMK